MPKLLSLWMTKGEPSPSLVRRKPRHLLLKNILGTPFGHVLAGSYRLHPIGNHSDSVSRVEPFRHRCKEMNIVLHTAVPGFCQTLTVHIYYTHFTTIVK